MKNFDLITDLGVDAPDEKTQYFDFIQGLKPDVKRQVVLARPNRIEDSMLMASRCDYMLFAL